MKKILIVLLVMITSLVYSNNLNKYESKRVFDKTMDAIFNNNFEKYKDDPEMTRALMTSKESLEDENWDTYLQWFKENKYEVLEVKESKNKSTLTVKATFNSFADIPNDNVMGIIFTEVYKASKNKIKSLDEEDDIFDEEFMINVTNKLMDKSKKETKEIKVYMDKVNGKWDLIEDEDNDDDIVNMELISTMTPLLDKFLEITTEFEGFEGF